MLDKACNRGSWVRGRVREYGLRTPSLFYFLINLLIARKRSAGMERKSCSAHQAVLWEAAFLGPAQEDGVAYPSRAAVEPATEKWHLGTRRTRSQQACREACCVENAAHLAWRVVPGVNTTLTLRLSRAWCMQHRYFVSQTTAVYTIDN